MPEFKGWPKIPRLHKDITITEKLDGTNACVVIEEIPPGIRASDPPPLVEALINDKIMGIWAQSRKRILTRETDNYGFAKWVQENACALLTLGEGYHYGEWWGNGIQRGYGLEKDDKRFSLFKVGGYTNQIEGGVLPSNVAEVPILIQGTWDEATILTAEQMLADVGSMAAPGYMNPEGIIVYHHHARQLFKLPFDKNPKGES